MIFGFASRTHFQDLLDYSTNTFAWRLLMFSNQELIHRLQEQDPLEARELRVPPGET